MLNLALAAEILAPGVRRSQQVLAGLFQGGYGVRIAGQFGDGGSQDQGPFVDGVSVRGEIAYGSGASDHDHYLRLAIPINVGEQHLLDGPIAFVDEARNGLWMASRTKPGAGLS